MKQRTRGGPLAVTPCNDLQRNQTRVPRWWNHDQPIFDQPKFDKPLTIFWDDLGSISRGCIAVSPRNRTRSGLHEGSLFISKHFLFNSNPKMTSGHLRPDRFRIAWCGIFWCVLVVFFLKDWRTEREILAELTDARGFIHMQMGAISIRPAKSVPVASPSIGIRIAVEVVRVGWCRTTWWGWSRSVEDELLDFLSLTDAHLSHDFP